MIASPNQTILKTENPGIDSQKLGIEYIRVIR